MFKNIVIDRLLINDFFLIIIIVIGIWYLNYCGITTDD